MKLLHACQQDLDPHRAAWRQRYGPFVEAVALGDHFRDGIDQLVREGELSPEQAQSMLSLQLTSRSG